MTRSSSPSRAKNLRLIGLVALVPLLMSCSTPAPKPTKTPKPTPTIAMSIAPLSGELLPSADLEHPSLAAKIDNHEDARPQWGLNRTDVVFEELVEGGLTRYVAVWHSDIPHLIGPVRSIRPMDPDIITPFGGIVAYSGGQQKFVDMMLDTPVYNAIHGTSSTENLMYRTDERDAPHNVIVKAQKLVAEHGDLAQPQQMFSFAPEYATVLNWRGKSANTINVTFSDSRYPRWTYSPLEHVYLRSQEGDVKDFDASSKTRIHATTVIVMFVDIDWTYGYVPKTVMVGSGKAWISSGGKSTLVTWSKASRSEPIVFTDASGRVVSIPAGNTWIEMPPRDGGSVSFK